MTSTLHSEYKPIVSSSLLSLHQIQRGDTADADGTGSKDVGLEDSATRFNHTRVLGLHSLSLFHTFTENLQSRDGKLYSPFSQASRWRVAALGHVNTIARPAPPTFDSHLTGFTVHLAEERKGTASTQSTWINAWPPLPVLG